MRRRTASTLYCFAHNVLEPLEDSQSEFVRFIIENDKPIATVVSVLMYCGHRQSIVQPVF